MDLLSRVFYDELPALGMEIREEQIYTAYRIGRSMIRGDTFLAEAGSGAGKTFAYLIPAVCHARRTGKPVVVACASSVLQSQLAGPGGDAETLSKLLNLGIDARLAGNPCNYLCEIKVEDLAYSSVRKKGRARLERWAQASKLGERSEAPDVPDDLWGLVAWDESLPCDTCKRRGYCRMVRAREHYRASTDLIVCSHELFFRDLWTREALQEAGLMPLLPGYGGVVFDEGHRVPDIARNTAGRFISRDALERTLRQLQINVAAVREYLPHLGKSVSVAESAMTHFWPALEASTTASDTARWHVSGSRLLDGAKNLHTALVELQDTIAIYEDLLDIETRDRCYTLQARLDTAVDALHMIIEEAGETTLYALDPAVTGGPASDGSQKASGSDGATVAGLNAVLWAVPRRIDRRLQQALFRQKLPVVFTSATLAAGGSFDYFGRMVGAPGARHASAGIPFDLARQAMVYLPPAPPEDPAQHLVSLLEATSGRALVLANTPGELAALRRSLAEQRLPWTMLWEGDASLASLVHRFRADTHSVLVGTSFWEGIDVPGEALSCVAVPWMPFPPDDPLLRAKQEEAQHDGLDPFSAVDVPEMALKLKQGCGRLIRTTADRGVFALLDTRFLDSPYQEAVESAFPEGAARTSDLTRVREFLDRERAG